MQVKLTQEGYDFLLKNRIFLTKVASGDAIYWDQNIELEPYISFPNAHICKMGAFSYSWSHLPNNIEMGRYCSIAARVMVMGENHPMDRLSTSAFTYNKKFQVFLQAVEDFGSTFTTVGHPIKPMPKLGHDVWVGTDVLIARGIKIGNGAVIGAGSVVTKDVPDYAIVGGAPAKLIRYRFPDAVIERLKAISWWKYAFPDFQGIDLKADIGLYLDQLEELIGGGKIKEFNPQKITLADLLAVQTTEATKNSAFTKLFR